MGLIPCLRPAFVVKFDALLTPHACFLCILFGFDTVLLINSGCSVSEKKKMVSNILTSLVNESFLTFTFVCLFVCVFFCFTVAGKQYVFDSNQTKIRENDPIIMS